jgi:hypothetical protein
MYVDRIIDVTPALHQVSIALNLIVWILTILLDSWQHIHLSFLSCAFVIPKESSRVVLQGTHPSVLTILRRMSAKKLE